MLFISATNLYSAICQGQDIKQLEQKMTILLLDYLCADYKQEKFSVKVMARETEMDRDISRIII